MKRGGREAYERFLVRWITHIDDAGLEVSIVTEGVRRRGPAANLVEVRFRERPADEPRGRLLGIFEVDDRGAELTYADKLYRPMLEKALARLKSEYSPR